MPPLTNILLVAWGGAIGSVSRYLLGGWAQTLSRSLDFPIGTLAVNLIGSFLIGLLAQGAETRGFFTPQERAFVFVGLLGGFTTFSSFGNDTVLLARQGQETLAWLNLTLTLLLGLSLVWLGRLVAAFLWR